MTVAFKGLTPSLAVTPCEYVDEPYIAPNTRYIVLLACEDNIILRLFLLTQYRRVPDRQTDKRTDRQTCYS